MVTGCTIIKEFTFGSCLGKIDANFTVAEAQGCHTNACKRMDKIACPGKVCHKAAAWSFAYIAESNRKLAMHYIISVSSRHESHATVEKYY